MHVLLVEHHPEVRELLAEVLEDQGHEVTAVADARGAYSLKRAPDVVVFDRAQPSGAAKELFSYLRGRLGADRLRTVVLAERTDDAAEIERVVPGPMARLTKPLRVQELTRLVAASARTD